MKTLIIYILSALAITLTSFANAEDETRLTELDSYWAKVSRAVKEGDFEAYASTCHPEGVLISDKKGSCYPLTQALEKWKPGFLETASGEIKANVEFRFLKRLGDTTTAHETGMFCYSSTDKEGMTTTVYVHLEALLIKKNRWLILMEKQGSIGTKEEWDDLKQ